MVEQEVDLLEHNALIANDLDEETERWNDNGGLHAKDDLEHASFQHKEAECSDCMRVPHPGDQSLLRLEQEWLSVSFLQWVSEVVVHQHHQMHRR